MNSLKEVQDTIRNAAIRHGFKWEAPTFGGDLPNIVSDNLNFRLLPTIDPASDWKGGKIRMNITASASVSRMGGSPTVEELFQTADEIRRGAELVQELQGMNLSCVYTT